MEGSVRCKSIEDLIYGIGKAVPDVSELNM